jgi:hypothetical protein
MPQLQEHIDMVVQRSSLTTLNDEGWSNIQELFLINVLVGDGRMKWAPNSSLLTRTDFFKLGVKENVDVPQLLTTLQKPTIRSQRPVLN